jgi:hypothetical protein
MEILVLMTVNNLIYFQIRHQECVFLVMEIVKPVPVQYLIVLLVKMIKILFLQPSGVLQTAPHSLSLILLIKFAYPVYLLVRLALIQLLLAPVVFHLQILSLKDSHVFQIVATDFIMTKRQEPVNLAKKTVLNVQMK